MKILILCLSLILFMQNASACPLCFTTNDESVVNISIERSTGKITRTFNILSGVTLVGIGLWSISENKPAPIITGLGFVGIGVTIVIVNF